MLFAKVEGNLTRLINPEAVAYAEYREYGPDVKDNELSVICVGDSRLSLRGEAAVAVMAMLESHIAQQRPEAG